MHTKHSHGRRGAPSGLVPVLATPFDSSGRLDVASLRRLVEWQIESGADALAVFGIASEAFSLDGFDRAKILDIVKRTAPGVPLIAGVAPQGLAQGKEEIERLAAAGVAHAMVMPPQQVKPSVPHLVEFFAELSEIAVDLGTGVMVQDAPASTGVTIPHDLLIRLCGETAISSVKIEAPPTVAKIAAVAVGTDKALLGGMNAQFVLDEYASGAVGTMPACEFTDLLRPVLDLWSAGDQERARAGFSRLLPLINWGLQPGLAWGIHKTILVHRGVISNSRVRAPAGTISPDMAQRTVEVFERVMREADPPHVTVADTTDEPSWT